MVCFSDRIKMLESDLVKSPPGFILNDKLPFGLFRYDPGLEDEDEWKVRNEIKKLAVRVENLTGKKVHQVSLADLFWKGIQDSEDIENLFELEEESGFEIAQDQVTTYLNSQEWSPLTDLLRDALSAYDPGRDIVFLIHASVFAPHAYRVSALLEQMMGKTEVPTVLFYPGSWIGTLNFMGLRSDEQPLGSYRVKIYGRD